MNDYYDNEAVLENLTETVREAFPDWSEEEVKAEVRRRFEEQ